MKYSIGEVAKILDLSTHTIRDWEKKGVIPKASRSHANFRRYSQEELEALRSWLLNRKKIKEYQILPVV